MTNIKNPDEYPKMLHFVFNGLCHETLSNMGFNPLDFSIRSLEICKSTNDFASTLIETNPYAIVLSMAQEEGRGRENKIWYSPIGGVWLTIGINSTKPVIELSTPVVLAIKKVIDEYIQCEVKEPNDILINGKKLCGVLVETQSIGNKFEKIVIGMGMNVYNDIPMEVKDIATRLVDYCDPPSIPELANKILRSVLQEIKDVVF